MINTMIICDIICISFVFFILFKEGDLPILSWNIVHLYSPGLCRAQYPEYYVLKTEISALS